VVSCRWTSDQEAAAYGRYRGSVSQADLERFFFLDDADEALVARDARGDYNRLGYSVQLTTVRYVGRFLADPLEGVPTEVIDFLAGQLGVADASCVKKYAQRCLVLRTCSGPTYRRGCPHRREAASCPTRFGPAPGSSSLLLEGPVETTGGAKSRW